MAGKGKREDRLATYRDRRDFRSTPEPRGGGGAGLEKGRHPIFVVQQHAARTMHWDFRLEVGGVLKSWALPKGPSTDPSEKRLAVETEDHPLEYADFEGVIPEGEYGGGTVAVWDAGPYRNLNVDDDGEELPMADALERGRAEVWLEGRKVRGGHVLVHAKVGGDASNWLLIKQRDEGADARRNPVRTQPESVLSGRTVEAIREEAEEDAEDEDE